MDNINHSRRRWLSLGGLVLGASMVPNTVLAMVSTAKPRILSFRNINTGERLGAAFSPSVGFSSSVLRKLDHFMRDKRNNQVHRMDPNLFMKLYRIQGNLGLQTAEIQIICGYRSPATNAMRHRQSRGVASNSFHVKGQAIDFRIDGTPLARIRQTAENLNNGGVGFYPRSNFIHVDTGPARTWRGV